MLQGAIGGDRAAQQRVLEAIYDYVRRLLYRLVGPGSDLDDLQQVVLMRVLTSLPTWRQESALSTWVGGICVHVARDHLRRKKVRSVVSSVEPTDRAIIGQQGSHDVHREAVAREQLAACHRALEQLSPNQRTAFVLHVVEGYSVDEVAQMMDAARSTTRMRLYYGRKKFAKAMAREVEETTDRSAA
ncbi:MAG: RNA polymerase sigma factor [Deltaproteobacteria bacterium]|nr:RNA polymerase sigma factor [Deltaproteobacteria bacterium]MBW2530547.1 RNA polymerase sigma factor [Deltaproteobacteria bacterium]